MIGATTQSAIDPFHPSYRPIRGDDQGDQGVPGLSAAHGREITDGAGRRFPTDPVRFGGSEEVNAFDHAIRLEEAESPGLARPQHSAIVSRPSEHVGSDGKRSAQSLNQGIFPQGSECDGELRRHAEDTE